MNKDSRLIKACLLRALSAALIVASETYAFMLFLSAYPQSAIPYLYFSFGIFLFIAMQLSQSLLKQNLIRFIQISNISFIILLFLFAFFIDKPYFWLPFVFALFIISATLFLNTVNLIALTALFNLREFKDISRWINISATIGAIFIGVLAPFLLRYFHSVILLYLNLALFLACFACLSFYQIPVENRVKYRHQKIKIVLGRDPLFIYTFFCFVLIIMLFIMGDFTLKSQLAMHYERNAIGEFLAPFFAITSVITILFQMLVVPIVLKRFGVLGVVMACPILYIVIASFLFIFPNFWSAVLVGGMATVIRYGFFIIGGQMLLNAYPPAVRDFAKYETEAIGRSLGMILGALILIVFFSYMNLRGVASFLIIIAFIMVLVSIRAGKAYYATVKGMINLHRFSLDYIGTKKVDQEFMFRIGDLALKDQHEDIKLFGLSLFRRFKAKKVPPSVIEALSSEFENVKISAIRVMRDSNDPKLVPFLMRQLALEKNPEIIWYLVEAILHFSPDFLLSYAMTSVQSQTPVIKASAVAIFLKAGNKQQIQEAKLLLEQMVNDSNWYYRYWACYILRIIVLPNSTEYIHQLLHDPDERVVWKIFSAASLFPNEKIIQDLIEQLSNRRFAARAGQTLVAIGPKALPLLLQQLQRPGEKKAKRAMIALLAQIPDEKAETALVDLLPSSSDSYKQKCAMTLAYRAKQFGISKRARFLIRAQALDEVSKIHILLEYRNLFSDEDIRREIQSKIFQSQKNFLYFLAACTQPKIILQIIPTLLNVPRTFQAFTLATELLELSIQDQALKNSISIVIEEKSGKSDLDLPKLEDFDPWLAMVVDFKRRKGVI